MENKLAQPQNKMGVMPVAKLLFTMSLPMIVSMLVQAFYNIVDSVFVASYNTYALDALSLAFPVQNLMIGVATGTGVGVNAMLSKALGEKNYDKVNKIAHNGVLLAFFGFLIFLIIGLFGITPFYNMQKVADESIRSFGYEYLSVCSIFSFGIFFEIMFERLMQSTGKTIFTLFTQGLGAVVNIILDPIFIFDKGEGFLNMGVFGLGAKGAAVATVVGQIAAAILSVVLNQLYNREIRLSIKGFKPDFKIIGRIYAIGVPSMIMVGIGSIMNFSLNRILSGFTAQRGVAVFGAYFKLQSFFFMPLFGMNNGVIPIIAYNYGAGNRRRMIKTVKVSATVAVCLMSVGFAIMQLIPDKLLMLFEEDPANTVLMADGIPALRIISYSFVLAGICIVLGSVFQALGHSVLSMIVSISRQLIVLIPAAYLLSLTGKLENVWLSFPIAELASVLASVICFIYLYKKIIRKIPEGVN